VKYSELARRICARKTGVGADGLLVMLSSHRGDLRMRIFNADGGEAEMCGNGIRCLVRYFYERKNACSRIIKVETLAGLKRAEIVKKAPDFLVRVNMGVPQFNAHLIGLCTGRKQLIEWPVKIMGKVYHLTVLSLGNPHAVLFLDKIPADWREIGRAIENYRLFPNRTNVEFVHVVQPGKIKMRSWERGAGPTLASGTGASAAVAAGIKTGRLKSRVEVALELGSLWIEQDKSTGEIYKTGPATYCFSGEFCL
jgi:diaminopimelate epimerase